MYVIRIPIKRITYVNIIISEQRVVIKIKNLKWFENFIDVTFRLKSFKRGVKKILGK